MNIRTLRADEIECRVQQVKQNGCVLLLYKDARVDMKLLDEVFGWDGWKREHQLIDGKLFCTVSVWSEKRNEWITKQDVGTESNTEKEKGQASDAFKRACVNMGIGRELYSSPFIWINLNNGEAKPNNKGGFQLDYKVKFKVSEIAYNDEREIVKLTVVDQDNKVRFNFGGSKKTSNTKEQVKSKEQCKNDLLKQVYDLAREKGYGEESVNKKIIEKGFSIENFNEEAFKVMFKGFSSLPNKQC